MSSVACPNGHESTLSDFCDVCGAPIGQGAAGASGAVASPAPEATAPNAVAGDAGVSPGPSAPVAPAIAVDWVAEVWVDPDWFAAQESDDACPSPGLLEVVPLRLQSLLIGRPSISRNIHPDIDLTGDPGVSRRQAQLTSDGARWWIEDLQSSNGTYVRSATGPIPTAPLTPGQRRELAEGDRVYVGVWTRLVVRRATLEEQIS